MPNEILIGIFTLVGIVIGGAINALISWFQSIWTAQQERKKALVERRIVALQNSVRLVDHILAILNCPDDMKRDGLMEEWTYVRKEFAAGGAFVPHEIRRAYQDALNATFAYRGSFTLSREQLEQMLEFRNSCIDHINVYYA